MTFLLVSFILIFLLIIFLNPKLGTFLIWPVLFTYPHGWWYYSGFLPLNIGYDDLFCIILFLVVLFRRNLIERVPIRIGYAFWVLTAFSIIGVIANLSGMLSSTEVSRDAYIKEILKMGVYWCLFYSILHCVDNERDLKIQFTMFSIAAVIGALLVIAQFYYPYRLEIFALPTTLTEGGLLYGARGAGAFTNANAAACVLVCSLVMVVVAMRLQRTVISKAIIYSFIFILLAGTLYTQSRAGLLALVGAFIPMSIVGRSKKTAWMVVLATIIVAVSFAAVRELYKERISEIYNPRSQTWGPNVQGRFETWKSYFRTAGFKEYVWGQGPRQGIIKNQMESHSAYVSLITVYGVSAVIWAILSLILFLKKVLGLRYFQDPLIATVSRGCFWALVAWGLYATSSDAITSHYPRYLLFYFVVLLDRVSYFARQQQAEWFYEQQEDTEQLPFEPEFVY